MISNFPKFSFDAYRETRVMLMNTPTFIWNLKHIYLQKMKYTSIYKFYF